jgi:hypothetical protein
MTPASSAKLILSADLDAMRAGAKAATLTREAMMVMNLNMMVTASELL